MKCAACNSEIPEGMQTVVWDLPNISFVCPKCTEALEAQGDVNDITGEMAEIRSHTPYGHQQNRRNEMADIVEQLKTPRKAVNGLPVGECYGCYDDQRAAAAAEIERLRYVLQQISIGNVGCMVKDGETSEGANLRVIKNIAAEAINR